MKRYWVKLTLEICDYDEATQHVNPNAIIKIQPATSLTPEPSKFISNYLTNYSKKLDAYLEEIDAITNEEKGE